MKSESSTPLPAVAYGSLLLVAAAKLSLHLLANRNYGFFVDELYFLACGERLDWGYVDQPPFIALAAAVSRNLLGESLPAIRFFPAVAGAALVFVSGLLAREMGGGRFAQMLTALSVLILPVFLYTHTVLTMNAFEPLWWTLSALVLARILRTGNQRLWLFWGLAGGVALQTKMSFLFFAAASVAGILLTAQRRMFLQIWIWCGGTLALALFSPWIIWQAQHHWPQIEILRNVTEMGKNFPFSVAGYLGGQVLVAHPLNVLLVFAGLWFFFHAAQGRNFRALGWTFVLFLGLMLLLKGKVYYQAPTYPLALAGGGVMIGAWIERAGRNWLRPALVTLFLAGGAVTAPAALPILPIESFLKYEAALGLAGAVKMETNKIGKRLPQLYADMFGWRELTELVARVYHSLPPEEQKRAAIFGSSYGEAGAVDFFGPAMGLPKALSGHNNYWLWGPGDYSGEIVITIGVSRNDDLVGLFESVEEAAVFEHPYASNESGAPILICRGARKPPAEIWPQLKKYI